MEFYWAEKTVRLKPKKLEETHQPKGLFPSRIANARLAAGNTLGPRINTPSYRKSFSQSIAKDQILKTHTISKQNASGGGAAGFREKKRPAPCIWFLKI